jgi:hypothetical protein
MKKRALAEAFKNPHRDENGNPKRAFRGYWEADRHIEKSGMDGYQSYYCRTCRGIHIDKPPKDPASERRLSLFDV